MDMFVQMGAESAAREYDVTCPPGLRVILGTAAVNDPEFPAPRRPVAGMDALGRQGYKRLAL